MKVMFELRNRIDKERSLQKSKKKHNGERRRWKVSVQVNMSSLVFFPLFLLSLSMSLRLVRRAHSASEGERGSPRGDKVQAKPL